MRIDCFKQSSDDWHGNFRIADDKRHEGKKFVHLSLMDLSTGQFRVCVWGNDDCGMERDFSGSDYPEALALYHAVASMTIVDRVTLQVMGFGYA